MPDTHTGSGDLIDIEIRRLKELRDLALHESAEEVEFGLLTSMAVEVCEAPCALVSLVFEDKLCFISGQGLDIQESQRASSFCSTAIQKPGDILEVEDARLDPRFRDSPLVTQSPNVVFYAGIPLLSHNGYPLATLCVLDGQPKKLTQKQRGLLRKLGRQAEKLFELQGKNHLLKQETQRLEEARRLLEQASRLARVGAWEKDFEAGTDHWSLVTRSIHDVGPDFKPSMENSLAFYKEGEHRQRMIEAVTHTRKTGRPYDTEVIVVTAKGRERWVRTIGNARMRDGKCVGLYGVIQDVTEQRQITEKLERLSLVAKNTTNAVVFTDANLKITWVNPGFTRITGYTPEEAIGKNPKFLQGEQTSRSTLERIRNSLRKELGVQETILNYRKSGQPYWNALEIKPYFDTRGELLGYFAIQSDVTEKRNTDEKLKSQSKQQAIATLIGGIANDFNNILANMTLSSDALKEDPALVGKSQFKVESLQSEIAKATQVTRQLLAFSKARADKLEQLKLVDFLKNTAEFALRGTSTVILLEGFEAEDSIDTYAEGVQLIFINLIIHARETLASHRELKIRRLDRDNSDYFKAEVSNYAKKHSGGEIHTESDPRHSNDSPPLNIYLHVAFDLVERLGGTITTCDSSEGAWVHIVEIPLQSGPSEEGAAGKSTLTLKAKKQTAEVPQEDTYNIEQTEVWLLEDDERQTTLLMSVFENEKLPARFFNVGEALLAAMYTLDVADQGAGRIFILDITIRGGKGGLDVCAQIRNRLPKSKIWLISGYSEEWERRREEFSDLDLRFMPKPYGLKDLREKVLNLAPVE